MHLTSLPLLLAAAAGLSYAAEDDSAKFNVIVYKATGCEGQSQTLAGTKSTGCNTFDFEPFSGKVKHIASGAAVYFATTKENCENDDFQGTYDHETDVDECFAMTSEVYKSWQGVVD